MIRGNICGVTSVLQSEGGENRLSSALVLHLTNRN